MSAGELYVVATPLGNLGDISRRALEILASVEVIAAEDTRHSKTLLAHFGITTPCIALHDHNERRITARLVDDLLSGRSIALISDAGTPLISDPGFHLVSAARQQGCRVVPVPGSSALICALSVSGLPSDRFVFEGFLPSRSAARRARLQDLSGEQRTLIFYESPHRIQASLQDMSATFGAERQAVLARELTKIHETVLAATLQQLALKVEQDADQRKGEIVVLVHGAPPPQRDDAEAELVRVLSPLLDELPLKQAVALAVKLTGCGRNQAYEMAVELKDTRD